MKAKYREKLLVHKVQENKDNEAFGELYDLYIEKIYRFVFIKLSNKEEAEDITSDVFLKTWNYLIADKKQFEIKSFSGLIYRIARNTLVDFFRHKSVRREYGIETLEDIGEDSELIEKIDVKHEVDNIMHVLKKMKREYQEIILLRYIEELSIAEIAEILEKRKTNVRVTLHRALKILKELLSKEASRL